MNGLEQVELDNRLDSSDEANRQSEKGYVLIMTGLLLIPMLIFAAFAVDVGGWYAQAARTQRAADAAALAAVVWMPSYEPAARAAVDVAARNGFVDGVDGTEIIVERVGDQQVRVRILSKGEVFFGAAVLDEIEIERFAVAEYVLPVPMGNPTSELGTGDAPGGDGIFLSINGVCMGRSQGDPFSARRYQSGQTIGCANNTGAYVLGENLNYDPEGYVYIIDVPEGAGVVNVEIKQPGLSCENYEDGRSYQNGRIGARLNTRLYANDSTPLSDFDNLEQTPVADITFSENACTGGISGDNEWYRIGQIPAGASGRWFLRVRGVDDVITGNSRDRSNGLNDYGLRARKSGTTTKCSSLNDSTCPQIYAKDWLSIYRPNIGNGPGDEAIFYLAEIGKVHAGKTLEIKFFDAGEGMHNIQILGPDGVAQSFKWEYYTCAMLGTSCPDDGLSRNPDTGQCSAVCLRTGDNSGDRFNDRAARMLIELPANYDCMGQSDCWWEVRYTPKANVPVTDRTTWSVAVIGDPVRLIE